MTVEAMHTILVEEFEQWRLEARRLLAENIHPTDVDWQADASQPSLFTPSSATSTQNEDASGDEDSRNAAADSRKLSLAARSATTVPQAFLSLAKHVACHRSPERWSLLYRTLWRIVNEQRELLNITTDDDTYRLLQMQNAVTRDAHKMKAFVRFRKVAKDPENYVAWHRPDHRIVRLVAPFFARRFKAMNWSIFTPDRSVSWDQIELRYGDGVPASDVKQEDSLEELWKTYYGAIFNPARVKVAMMKREMPIRHWPTLPEAALIPELLAEAPSRVDEMLEAREGFAQTAAHFLPEDRSLPSLADAATRCAACDLCHYATQVVFGEGLPNARIVLIGEQPGDQEDFQGRPFVGPAGQLLEDCLASAGIQRNDVYLTNTVKHFKFTQRGKQRLHKKPSSREIYACRPWLEAELSVLQPDVVVCLGATPAQALFGRDFRVAKSRGQLRPTEWCERTVATWHPAAILRLPEEAARLQRQRQLIDDLRLAVTSQ